MDDKVIFYNETSLGIGLGRVSISMLSLLYPCSQITENLNPIKVWKTGRSRLVAGNRGYRFCCHI